MNRILVAALGVLALLYFVNQERRMHNMEDSIQEMSGTIKEIKKAVVPGTTVEYTEEDEECLTKNIFFEAGVEKKKGKIAVGQVTINRVKAGRWGSTICEVVYAPSQFSWTLFKDKLNEVPSGPNWVESQEAAKLVLKGEKLKHLEDAHFYHTDYIATPKWADNKYKISQVGKHIFYTKDKIKKVKAKMDKTPTKKGTSV